MNKAALFPGGKKLALTLSYDDDTVHDIRFVEILNKYGIKCTFNLNGGLFKPKKTDEEFRSMTLSEAQGIFKGSCHEVATHGLTHPFYTKLGTEEADKDIRDDIDTLSEKFSCEATGHAYPFGDYNDDVIDILSKNGIIYARTTKATNSFGFPENFMEWHPTCHHREPRLFELFNDFVNNESGELRLFYLWGHAFEFAGDKNWELIEKFCELAGGRNDIWYCTNKEFYYWIKNNF